MSMYTTGEIAKLCGVTVRTVQYYDSRNILVPSQLSEGGRRLYSEEDLDKMKIICFLREIDLPINSIAQLLKEEHPEEVISLILSQQQKNLQQEIQVRQDQLGKLQGLQRNLKSIKHFSMDSIGDIATMMKHHQQHKKVRTILISIAIPFGIAEWTSIALWAFQGICWPFLLYTLAAIPSFTWLVGYYYRNVSYICPECHKVFKPTRKAFFFSQGTFTARKLTCPCCRHRGYCVETCGDTEKTGSQE